MTKTFKFDPSKSATDDPRVRTQIIRDMNSLRVNKVWAEFDALQRRNRHHEKVVKGIIAVLIAGAWLYFFCLVVYLLFKIPSF